MRSHLESGPERTPRRTVFDASEIDAQVGGGLGAISRTAHGEVVDASTIHDHIGGSRGVLEGAPRDSRERMYSEAFLPQEAANWRGSATRYAEGELPDNDHSGMGFYGSREQYSLQQLDAIDQQHGTGVGVEQPQSPGAYLQPDNTVLLINHDGRRAVVTQEQYRELMQRHIQAQQQAGSLGSRLLGALRRKGG